MNSYDFKQLQLQYLTHKNPAHSVSRFILVNSMENLVNTLSTITHLDGSYDTVNLENLGFASIVNCRATQDVTFPNITDPGLYINFTGKNSAYSLSFLEYPPESFAFKCTTSVVPEQIKEEKIVIPKNGQLETIRIYFPIDHDLTLRLFPNDADEFFKPLDLFDSSWQIQLSGEFLKLCQSVWHCDFEGEARDLWMQAKIRELLALLMVMKVPKSLSEKACLLVKQRPHYAWNISNLSQALGTNECYLKDSFRQKFKMGASRWIQNYRIQLAKDKLAFNSESITEIALTLGYQNSSYFAKVFKQSTGLTPKQFREQSISR